MAVHASHAAIGYPIKGARFSILVPYMDADGDPTAPTTPDTEISKDNAAAADCAEEVSATSGMDGMGLLTLSGAEMDCSCAAINAKVASGPKATLLTLYPRVLPTVTTGTAQAGANGTITLASGASDYDLAGCIVKTTGGTGGGGTGGANNQARVITAYNTTTKVATVVPDWETTPDNTTTYEVLMTEIGAATILISSRATPAQVNTEVLDVLNVDTLIDGKTIKEALLYIAAVCAGRVSGAGTGTEIFKGLDEATTRVTVTVDSSGNRTDVTYG